MSYSYSWSRRRVLAAGAGAAGLAVTQGCLDDEGTTAEDETGGTLPEGVPADRRSGWRMAGGERYASGFEPSATPPTEDVTERWRFTPDADGWIHMTPAVADGTVFLASSDGPVWALDFDDQRVQWEADLESRQYTPVVWDDWVVWDGSKEWVITDRETGERRPHDYSYSKDTLIRPYDGDIVQISNPGAVSTRTVYHQDTETGDSDGIHDLSTEVDPTDRVLQIDDVYVAGFEDGSIEAFDLAAGEQVWRSDPPREGTAIVSSSGITTDGDRVYATPSTGIWDSELHGCYAVDAATGEHRWEAPIEETYLPYPPAVGDGVVYYGNERLYALDAETGDELWSVDRRATAQPTIADGAVFCHDEDEEHVYALDAETGETLWEYDTPMPTDTQVVPHRDVVLVVEDYGESVVALEAP